MGLTKLAGERWCEYYLKRYNIDVRSLRYPGLISYKTEAGGGTTDYAVEIFYEAVRNGSYTSFLSADTALPLLFMPDAIKGYHRPDGIGPVKVNGTQCLQPWGNES